MLTEHQSEILHKSLDILKNGNRLLITGSAGVGKTYMVDELVKHLRAVYGGTFYLSAPTNQAVSVLKGKITPHPNSKLITTHKALKIKRFIDNNTGSITFKASFDSKYPPLKGVKYLIIDESSMIPLWLQMEIEEHADKQGCKVVFIGDNQQIQPVGEADSPVFLGKPRLIPKGSSLPENHTCKRFYDEDFEVAFLAYPEVELTEIVRQKDGSPIIDLSRNLALISTKEAVKNESGGYIYSNEYDKVLSTLAHVNGTDELKYLAYTNAEVDKVNRDVRKAVYGPEPAKIEKDETLVFNAPFKEYYTNEELKVEKLLVREKVFKFLTVKGKYGQDDVYEEAKLKYYSINFKNSTQEKFLSLDSWNSKESSEEVEDNIIVIHEDSEANLKKIFSYLKAKANAREIDWTDYFEFIESFADLKYNHAITIHKSQGSTFKQGILNYKNIKLCQDDAERQRLLYTGVTRASELLILYNV